MSYTRFLVVYCDAKSQYCAWDDDPMHGDADETLTEILRRAGWITKNGQHICPQCQHPELEGMPHPSQSGDDA